jgi:hypothetical protein
VGKLCEEALGYCGSWDLVIIVMLNRGSSTTTVTTTTTFLYQMMMIIIITTITLCLSARCTTDGPAWSSIWTRPWGTTVTRCARRSAWA